MTSQGKMMHKYFLLLTLIGLSIHTVSFAEKTDLSATKWVCTTNSQNATEKNENPVKEQIVDDATGKNNPANMPESTALNDKLANSSLANAFSLAVKNCEDCTDIHCVMQK